MIPIRLEITNFLAYKNPAPLDFTGLHVAVLVGENGAGKSSLLDAMTWAVWGRARAKTDAELVHQGQTEMRVEFTFALGDQTYRVIRAKRVGRGASGALDLQALLPDGRWNSLSDATIPKTQDRIQQLLRLSYDTFINSAYLMQGQADEFTSKRPTERKQILADILGLKDWETYETRAKERLRRLELDLAGLDAIVGEMETELKRRAEYEATLLTARGRALEVRTRLAEAEAGWAQIDAARQALLNLDRQATDLTRRLKDAEREIATLTAEVRDATVRADAAALGHEIESAQARLAELDRLEQEREARTTQRQTLGERTAQLRGQNEALEAEANTLKKRLETMGADATLARKRLTDTAQADRDKINKRLTTLQTALDPRCPTCGQALTGDARTQLLADLTTELTTRESQLQTDLTTLDAERAQSAASINTDLEARRAVYRQNQAEVKKLTEEQTVLDRDLKRFGDDLRERATVVKRVAELQSALAHADEAQARVTALTERLNVWQNTLEADRAKRAELDTEAARHEAILRDSAQRQAALDRLRQEDTLLRAQLMAAEQKLAALDGLTKQREAKRLQRDALAEECGLVEELKDAFGKKGVPTMMIEAAVPEIEAAANTLLARMTAGRMHVRFNTQKETQGGEVRETLDIQISDELGTRAYELYSGGEAFRVNFAIRLALSQLLARRAGTQLQALIIDEGFGVLDASGRERLIEAINAAQDDFQRILVVTHIDELKDAFPARIEITKGPHGSEIMVA